MQLWTFNTLTRTFDCKLWQQSNWTATSNTNSVLNSERMQTFFFFSLFNCLLSLDENRGFSCTSMHSPFRNNNKMFLLFGSWTNSYPAIVLIRINGDFANGARLLSVHSLPTSFLRILDLMDYHLWKYVKLFGLTICCKHTHTHSAHPFPMVNI